MTADKRSVEWRVFRRMSRGLCYQSIPSNLSSVGLASKVDRFIKPRIKWIKSIPVPCLVRRPDSLPFSLFLFTSHPRPLNSPQYAPSGLLCSQGWSVIFFSSIPQTQVQLTAVVLDALNFRQTTLTESKRQFSLFPFPAFALSPSFTNWILLGSGSSVYFADTAVLA